MIVTKNKLQYKEIFGIMKDEIPILIKTGYKPTNVAEIMDLRLQGHLEYNMHEIDSIDLIRYNQKGDIKIIRNSQVGKKFLTLSDETFEELIGKDILYLTKKEKEELNGKWSGKVYTQESVKNSEVWNFLARENSRLVKYVDNIFPEMKKKFGKRFAMDLRFNNYYDDHERLTNIRIGSLGGGSDSIMTFENYKYGRIIGIKQIK